MTASAKQMPLDHSGSTTRTKPRRLWLRLILALVVVLIAGFVALGVWPAPAEFTGDEGTVGVATGGGGLKKDFPAMVIPADNTTADPKNDERVALGRLLFLRPNTIRRKRHLLRDMPSSRSGFQRRARAFDWQRR